MTKINPQLSEKQEQQAQAIAQYDVKAAARYCKVVATNNQAEKN